MTDNEKAQIQLRLTEIIVDLIPDATLRPMYGGQVIELRKDDPKSRVGGIYAYANYVSLELAKGATFDDPIGVLEGSGKLRRHVKLHKAEDIETKFCAVFFCSRRVIPAVRSGPKPLGRAMHHPNIRYSRNDLLIYIGM